MPKPKKTDLQLAKAEEFKALVRKNMPEFVAEIETKEDFFNASAAAGQELLLVIEDVLVRHFKFTDKDLRKLHDETKDVLRGVKEFEHRGLSMLSGRDVAIVGDKIAEVGLPGLMAEISGIRLEKEKLNRMGMEYPTLPGTKPFYLKEVKKRNK